MSKMNTSDVYEFVQLLKTRSISNNCQELASALDDAMNLGSSGLEILGAIRSVLLHREDEIKSILVPNELTELKEIIHFVNKMYGR